MVEQIDLDTVKKIRALADIDQKCVLEIGCGDGRVTVQLEGSPQLLVALDPDETRINDARRNLSHTYLLASDGEKLPFTNGSFDVVLFTLSLHHQNPVSALQEAWRVVKEDGEVVILEPVNEGELEEICNLFNNEGEVLAEALHAVEISDFEIMASHVYCTEWQCNDKQALNNWLFDYYAKPFDSKLAQQVVALLGDKANDKPLVLQDMTRITALRK